MKWINHITTTTTLSYFAGIHEPNLLGISAFFSVFPDAMESLWGFRVIPHRTISHSVLFWNIIFILSYIFVCAKFPIYQKYWYAFAIGITGHLLGDSLTITGVPIFFKKPRIALKLFKTGSFFEYVFSLIFFIILLIRII